MRMDVLIKEARQEAGMCNAIQEVYAWIDWFESKLCKDCSRCHEQVMSTCQIACTCSINERKNTPGHALYEPKCPKCKSENITTDRDGGSGCDDCHHTIS